MRLDRDPLETFTALFEQRWSAPYVHLLVPTDFGVTAAHALQHAIRLARQHGAALTMLHVLPGMSSMIAVDVDHGSADIVTHILEDCRMSALARLAALVPSDLRCRIHSLVATGETPAAILHTAARLRVDLIVMGRPSCRGWRRFFARDYAGEVVRRAPCPVLLVEAPVRYELVNT
jgi:nucleotide-binding universal stress UspA family protein